MPTTPGAAVSYGGPTGAARPTGHEPEPTSSGTRPDRPPPDTRQARRRPGGAMPVCRAVTRTPGSPPASAREGGQPCRRALPSERRPVSGGGPVMVRRAPRVRACPLALEGSHEGPPSAAGPRLPLCAPLGGRWRSAGRSGARACPSATEGSHAGPASPPEVSLPHATEGGTLRLDVTSRLDVSRGPTPAWAPRRARPAPGPAVGPRRAWGSRRCAGSGPAAGAAPAARTGQPTRPYQTLLDQIFWSFTTSPVFGACQILLWPA